MLLVQYTSYSEFIHFTWVYFGKHLALTGEHVYHVGVSFRSLYTGTVVDSFLLPAGSPSVQLAFQAREARNQGKSTFCPLLRVWVISFFPLVFFRYRYYAHPQTTIALPRSNRCLRSVQVGRRTKPGCCWTFVFKRRKSVTSISRASPRLAGATFTLTSPVLIRNSATTSFNT